MSLKQVENFHGVPINSKNFYTYYNGIAQQSVYEGRNGEICHFYLFNIECGWEDITNDVYKMPSVTYYTTLKKNYNYFITKYPYYLTPKLYNLSRYHLYHISDEGTTTLISDKTTYAIFKKNENSIYAYQYYDGKCMLNLFTFTGENIFSKETVHEFSKSITDDMICCCMEHDVIYIASSSKIITYNIDEDKEEIFSLPFSLQYGIMYNNILYGKKEYGGLYAFSLIKPQTQPLLYETSNSISITSIRIYNDMLYFVDKDNIMYVTELVTLTQEEVNNDKHEDSQSSISKLFYVTKDGKLHVKGDIEATSLTLAEDATVTGKITSGGIGGWEIGSNGLKSIGFDNPSNTNGIRLDSNGEIRSKGSWYSSAGNDGTEGWFARLCSGKWIFGYYDSTQSDPFVPPKDTPYSDISVNGIYMCSKDTILNKNSQYLFAVDTTKDTVNITNSSKTSPALTITNNYYDSVGGYDAPALVLHSPKQGYRNRPFDARLKVTGKLLGTDQTVNAQYSVALFGEEQLGRIIFRSNTFDTSSSPVGNTVSDTSSDPTVPAILGSDRFRWYQGYFMELYSKNGVNTSSDKKIKNHIGYMDTDKSLELVNDLKPVEYTLKDNANGRKHMGFYAQDVKDTANKLDLGNISLYSATWNKDGHECYYSDEAPDDELSWSLKYEEFIAPLVGSVQALTREVHTLKEEIKRLKGDNVR